MDSGSKKSSDMFTIGVARLLSIRPKPERPQGMAYDIPSGITLLLPKSKDNLDIETVDGKAKLKPNAMGRYRIKHELTQVAKSVFPQWPQDTINEQIAKRIIDGDKPNKDTGKIDPNKVGHWEVRVNIPENMFAEPELWRSKQTGKLITPDTFKPGNWVLAKIHMYGSTANKIVTYGFNGLLLFHPGEPIVYGGQVQADTESLLSEEIDDAYLEGLDINMDDMPSPYEDEGVEVVTGEDDELVID